MTWLLKPYGVCQCDCCGQFIAHKEFAKNGGASWAFVPESDVSREEDKVHCKRCTNTYGMPAPNQSVRLDMCQGKF